MLDDKDIKSVLDGDSKIGYLGNVYEFVGYKDGKCIMQSVNSDYHMLISVDNMMKSEYCSIF